MTRDKRCPRTSCSTGSATASPTGTPTKNINTVAPFLTLAYLYEEKPDSSWLPYLDEWAEWLMDGLPRTEEDGFQHIVFNSENREQLWDDTLMMAVLPLAKIGLLLDRPHYVEEAQAPVPAAHQVPVRSQDRPVVPRLELRRPPPFRRRAVGARQLLGDDRDSRDSSSSSTCNRAMRLRDFLIDTHLQQISTLVKHQDESGLWHTLIDDPKSYLEASATAGFAYGILKSRAQGLHRRANMKRSASARCKAVLANIDKTGELKQVSFGTPVFRRPRRLPQASR